MKLMNVTEMAEYLRTTETALRQMLGRTDIPRIKLGTSKNARVLFPVEKVDAWLETQEVPHA